MHHMKTATVRDLRYAFSRVSRWISDGEAVQITLRGQAFAVLAPTKRRKRLPREWPDFAARRGKLFPRSVGGKPLSNIVSEGRGDR